MHANLFFTDGQEAAAEKRRMRARQRAPEMEGISEPSVQVRARYANIQQRVQPLGEPEVE